MYFPSALNRYHFGPRASDNISPQIVIPRVSISAYLIIFLEIMLYQLVAYFLSYCFVVWVWPRIVSFQRGNTVFHASTARSWQRNLQKQLHLFRTLGLLINSKPADILR